MEKKFIIILLAFILLLFLLISGCINEQNGSKQTNDEETNDEPTNQNNSGQNQTNDNENESDPCGNAIGNGNEIVSGPPGHEGTYNIDNPFRSLTVHPSNSDIVLVGTERNGFLKSIDGGQSWIRLRAGLRHSEINGVAGYPEVYDIAFSPSNPEVIYAATLTGPGPLIGEYAADGGIYKSVDGGQTWQRKNCGLDNGWIFSVYVFPGDPNNVIIGVSGGETTGWGTPISGQYFDGGIFRSIDGGDNWNRVDIAPNDNTNGYRIITAAKDDPTLLYIFGLNMENRSTNIGFVKSNDGGITWNQFASDLREYDISYFDISSNGNVIYAAASDIYRILKSIDSGETWSEYFIKTSGYAIAVSPSNSARVLFSKTSGLYLSTDGLETESQVISTEGVHIADVVFAPSDNNIVYAITDGYNFYKSTDAGVSFLKIANLRDDILNIIP